MEVWAGLLDYGYTPEEIALILDVATPGRCVEWASFTVLFPYK